MKDLLNRARLEIIGLRRQNEVLEAQVGVMEVFAAALGLKHVPQGATVDVAWELEKEIECQISMEKMSGKPGATSFYEKGKDA